MAAKWQQWMPFHIDKFMGSRYVQAMQPCGRAGYLYLLAAQWQSDDCSLPKDEEELAVLSGLGCETWQEHGRSIMRHFAPTDEGRIRNAVLFEEWTEAKTIHEKRWGAAIRTNQARNESRQAPTDTVTARSPHGHRTLRARSATADRDTGTGTETQKQKPSGDTSPGDASGEKVSSPSKAKADPRHAAFHEQIDRYWKHYTGEDKAPWDGSEGKALSALLAAKPDLTLEQFRLSLKHRGDSPGEVPTERPRQWLPNVLRFLGGPLDRYGKPLQASKPAPQLRGVTLEEAMQR